MEERIKEIYNDCWAIYKRYLENNDMAQYNKDKDAIFDKYDGRSDVSGLLLWWAGRVQSLHDEYERAKERRDG